ncbi:MAG: type II toxin-antitoxin system Phd/YefM family antitoxin [Acetatifactor sp.]|nr:type II toxin-antitoxin system Phd/YefM family antitoxin [Acetatifactor sp.]
MKILIKVLHIIKAWHIIREDGEVDTMGVTLLDLTERLVPISDFSQGKAGKIFHDVAENNNEYIILKNNQPTAVLLSVKEYRDTQAKVAKLEEILEKIENIRLLKLAESRAHSNTSSFETFVNEQGFSIEELEEISENVEFE